MYETITCTVLIKSKYLSYHYVRFHGGTTFSKPFMGDPQLYEIKQHGDTHYLGVL